MKILCLGYLLNYLAVRAGPIRFRRRYFALAAEKLIVGNERCGPRQSNIALAVSSAPSESGADKWTNDDDRIIAHYRLPKGWPYQRSSRSAAL